MQYEISNRMSDVHGSAIRELFKLGADPNMISFGGGNPSAETFPVPEIADIIADVMKDAPLFCSTVCPRATRRCAIR